MSAAPKSGFRWTVVRYVALLVPLCFYVRYRIEPHIAVPSHPGFPLFYAGPAFLRELLGAPGGLGAYLAGLLAQSFYSPWGGSLVITALVGLAIWATDALIVAMGGERVRGLAFVPGILLIGALNALFGQLILIVPLLAALLTLVVYVGLVRGSDVRRLAAYLLLAAAVYYVAGGAFLLFGVVAALYELLVKRARLPALVCLLSLEAIPYVAVTYLFPISLVGAYTRGLPGLLGTSMGPVHFVAACYLYIVLLALGLGLWRRVAERRAQPAPAKPVKSRKRTSPGLREYPLAGTIAVLALAAVVAATTFDAQAHRVIRVDYFTWREDWNGVLREAQRLPLANYTEVVGQDVNLALYEKGRLGDEMFAYPQTPLGLMADLHLGSSPAEQDALMGRRTDLWFQLGDLDLRLGLANETEHEAHEALAVHGPHPEIIKRLALVNLVKQQPDAARVFLNALRLSPAHSSDATRTLQHMASDPRLSHDPRIARYRSGMLLTDRKFMRNSLETRCLGLLEDHPNNRMAFEYLMAWYLLKRDLDSFARQLPRLRVLGYSQMPRHYQEALLLHEKATMKVSDRAGYPISPEVLQSFADFAQAVQAPGAGPAALAPDFGDTYFFYSMFSITGAMVQR